MSQSLEYLIRQACKWPVGEPDPVVIIGGPQGSGRTPAGLDAPELAAKGPRPVYPLEVWEGTVYGEFGAACSARNFIPPKFFIESLRTSSGPLWVTGSGATWLGSTRVHSPSA